MAMSQADMDRLQQVISATVLASLNGQAQMAQAQAAQGRVPLGDGGGRGRLLDERGFRRMEKFSGSAGEEAWREWEFDFRTAVRAMSTHTAAAMEKAVQQPDILTTGHMIEMGDVDGLYPDMQRRSVELFEVLCGLMTGDAKMLIRETNDGIMAWQILAKTYSRRTMARVLRKYREATLPKQVETKDLVGAIAKWESGVKALEREEGVLPDMVKLAALTEICPAEIRDMIYQNCEVGHGGRVPYLEIKEKVVSWIGNRMAAANGGATPMDVGCVDKEHWGEEEVDVNLIKCYTCGGQGHPARLCPSPGTPTGKGAGGKGKGEAKGKGEPKGYGKGGAKGGEKGKGKGYQGNCFHCGQLGHKAIECPNWWKQKQGIAMVDEVMEEMADENAEIGGVWMIGSVEVKTTNSFQVLEEDDIPELVDSEEEEQPKTADTEDDDLSELGNDEDRWITQVEEKRESVKCGMAFHVTDAKKLLASVAKMTEAGNEVHFGPKIDDNFIKCTKSGRITPMRKERGMYVIDAFFENGDKMMKGKIVVDSGAAENVMPAEVLDKVKLMPKKAGIRFVAANGEEMKNYGRKTVTFIPAAVEGFTGPA
jgi:hypothetical protein